MSYELVNVLNFKGGLDKACEYYHSKWGTPDNLNFFKDAMVHSTKRGKGLPRFYLLLDNGKIIGCGGLIINDFISRHDLYPWLCGLFIEESHRGRGLGKLIMEYIIHDATLAGFDTLYLTTDHDGYYEKYDWTRIEDGFEPSGERTRIYKKKLTN